MDRLRVEGVGASGLCGVLPLVAGAVLVALGVWLLWVSRKRGGPLWWTLLRRALVLVAALFVVYWVVLPVSMAIVATERPSVPVKAVDLGRPYEKVTLTTRDGLKLSAWYVPSLNHAAVITFPRQWTTEQARMLVKNGYGVLLVDPRGFGDSQGDPDAYGWGSAKDIDAAVAWLRRRPDVQRRRIGGLGLSMGGEQMLEAAALNPGLKAVVSEGAGIRSVREALLPRGPSQLELALQYPQALVQTVSVWLLSGEPVPISLKNASLLIAPRATSLHLRRERPGGGEVGQPRVLRRRLLAQGHLDGAGSGAHAGHRDAAQGVRAPRGRVLRQDAARDGVAQGGSGLRRAEPGAVRRDEAVAVGGERVEDARQRCARGAWRMARGVRPDRSRLRGVS